MTPHDKPIRVALADDHPIVLDGLEGLFRLEPDFAVVARCRDGEEVLDALREHRPDLLVLDLRMPKVDGLAVLAALRQEGASTRVLLLTAAVETPQVAEALRLGARGLVLKEAAPDVVVEAARRIHEGGQWFDAGQLARAVEELSRGAGQEISSLTPRERDIVRMVARGMRNREIADRLGISEGTVKLHLHHVYEKLELSGRLELLIHLQKHEI